MKKTVRFIAITLLIISFAFQLTGCKSEEEKMQEHFDKMVETAEQMSRDAQKELRDIENYIFMQNMLEMSKPKY